MANYYRQFVPRFSEIANGLQEAINQCRRTKKFTWSEQAEDSFNQIRKAISQRIKLSIPDPNRKFSVTIDSSEKGWRLELKQDDTVVSFNSGTFNELQRRYSPCERECLGIVLGLEKV